MVNAAHFADRVLALVNNGNALLGAAAKDAARRSPRSAVRRT